MTKKRGQAAGAASFVAVMVGLIILYILFIPPAERDALLNLNASGTGTVASSRLNLLSETPGTLYKQKDDKLEHNLGQVKVQVSSEDKLLKNAGAAYIESSQSSQKTKTIILVLDDPKATSNVFLSFAVAKHSGKLIIKLNDIEIFNGEINNIYATPIELTSLKEENVLVFSVPSTGWQFWQTNYYSLSDIKIMGTLRNTASREAIVTFSLDESEANNIKSADLTYYVGCAKAEGRLSVYLNQDLLSSKLPDCGSYEQLSLSPESLMRGSNELSFSVTSGSVLVDRILLTANLREAMWPVYYFDVEDADYYRVRNDSYDAVLFLKFADDNAAKEALLTINDHKTYLDTGQKSYSKNIDNYIEKGSNYIMIEPRTVLNIVEMRVDLEKK